MPLASESQGVPPLARMPFAPLGGLEGGSVGGLVGSVVGSFVGSSGPLGPLGPLGPQGIVGTVGVVVGCGRRPRGLLAVEPLGLVGRPVGLVVVRRPVGLKVGRPVGLGVRRPVGLVVCRPVGLVVCRPVGLVVHRGPRGPPLGFGLFGPQAIVGIVVHCWQSSSVVGVMLVRGRSFCHPSHPLVGHEPLALSLLVIF